MHLVEIVVVQYDLFILSFAMADPELRGQVLRSCQFVHPELMTVRFDLHLARYYISFSEVE